jgi:signal recognition particle subunit SRP19
MVGKREGRYVIWPSYFDRGLSREKGRKVPIKLAVENPSIEKIARAAKTLGLNPVIEKDARYPSRHWEGGGRVLVEKKNKKSSILKSIARLMKI